MRRISSWQGKSRLSLSRCLYIVPLFALFSSALLIFYFSPSASAASAYDDNYVTTDSVTAKNPVCANGIDVTNNWATIIQNSEHPSANDAWTALSNAFDNGRWGVSEWYSPGAGYQGPIIFFTEDDSLYLDWTSIQYGVYAFGNNIKVITLEQKNDCETVDIASYSSSEPFAYVSQSDSNPRNLFVYTDHPNYPSGYEGPEVPDSYNPPAPPLDWVPDLHVVAGIDNKVTIQDRHFNTFDENPFTCNEGLTPVINYELKDVNSNVIDSGTISATIQYTYQHQNELAERTYSFTASYYCGSEPDDPTFSSSSTVSYTLTQGGTLKNDLFASCMDSEFPFLHFDACMTNIETAISMLSFGVLKFGNDWQTTDGCTQLNVLDDWLNITNGTVCPFFSNEVRNIVTPFVTLLLGLITMNFIFKIGNDSNG